jgi:hypothetical protein
MFSRDQLKRAATPERAGFRAPRQVPRPFHGSILPDGPGDNEVMPGHAIPFITRLSAIKADPKTEASFDQEQTARCKTFIWSPFVGGLSAFAVILPRPFSC